MTKKANSKKPITLSFPFVAEDKQEDVVGFLEANGFEIKSIKARAAFGDLTVVCYRTSAPICLCCLSPLQDSDTKESNQLCIYCSAGDCEIEASKFKFEKGHGNIQKILHSEEAETTEEDSADDDNLDVDADEFDDTDLDDEE